MNKLEIAMMMAAALAPAQGALLVSRMMPVAVAEGYRQEVLVQNTGAAAVAGPVDLLVNRMTTEGGGWTYNRKAIVRTSGGLAYQHPVDLGGDGVLAPGETGRAVIEFRQASLAAVQAATMTAQARSTAAVVPAANDFDGDGVTDVMLYRPASGEFLVRLAATGEERIIGGGPGGGPRATPLAADFDGDSKADPGFYDDNSGELHYQSSRTRAWVRAPGSSGLAAAPGDVGVASGDTDHDDLADLLLYQKSTARFRIRASGTGQWSTFALGEPGASEPASADYDGDGVTDLAVWTRSTRTLLIRRSTSGIVVPVIIPLVNVVACGSSGTANDLSPLPGDLDGDGRADLVFYSPSWRLVVVQSSETGYWRGGFVAGYETDPGELVIRYTGLEICGGNGNDSLVLRDPSAGICGGNGNDSIRAALAAGNLVVGRVTPSITGGFDFRNGVRSFDFSWGMSQTGGPSVALASDWLVTATRWSR